MLRIKHIFAILLLLLLFSSPKKIFAKDILFQDNFNDGNSNGWFETSPWGSWTVQNNSYIGQAQLIQSPALPSISTIGDEKWQDYEFSVNIKSLLGIDKQILFRVNTSQNRAYILNMRSSYFNGGNDIILAKRSPLGTEKASLLLIKQFINSQNTDYKVKIQVKNTQIGTNIVVYINENEEINYLDNDNPILNGKIGLEVVPGGYMPGNPIGLITKISYDEVLVTSLENKFDMKQYDPKWKDVTYDSADIWSPGKSTIERYGCAVTSAAMILQNYGHSVTPETLNSWLIDNDGYVGEGLLNWSAVTKWAKESNESNPDAKKLEYKRYSFTTEKLDEELTATRPAILKLKNNDTGGTHFVVVTNKDQSVYKMSDPATENEDLSFYPSDRYNRINSFVPSNTDLSYLYSYLSPTHTLKVFSPSGTELDGIDEEATYEDQVDHTVLKKKQLTTFEWAKPTIGKYKIQVTGNGAYSLETRYYDSLANLEKKDVQGKSTNTTDTYFLTIGEQTSLKKVDFAYLKELLTNAYSGNKIKNKGVYQALYSTAVAAEKTTQKQNTKLAKVLLDVMIFEIKLSRKYIVAETSTELINTIQILKESL